MNDFWVGSWLHSPPKLQFVNGRRVLLKKLCFGPAEAHVWFVTEDGRCWHEHQLLEDLQEEDRLLEPVSQEELSRLLGREIVLCQQLRLETQCLLFQEEKERWT